MPKFAANLSMMFTEVPFLDRFEQAAKAGFAGVEFLFPYAFDPAELAERLKKHGLTLALINMPPGDWDAGERGMAAIPGREAEFRANVETAITYARALGGKKLHAMAGLIPEGADRKVWEETYIANMRHAADRCAEYGITVLAESLNPRNMPGYFLLSQRQSEALVARIDRPNVKMQLDIYHAQITDGDLTKLIESLAGKFGHVQIASVPDRHEPDEGEINYPHIYAALEKAGYRDWIGCEYNPRATTLEGVSWLKAYPQS